MRPGRVRRRRVPRVATITTAPRPLAEDVADRTRRYLTSMAIRTACVVLAAVVDWPWRWVFIAGAVILPYLAVVFANAGRERATPADSLLDLRAITSGPEGGPPPAAEAEAPPGPEDRGPEDRGPEDERTA